MSSKNNLHRESRSNYVLNIVLVLLIIGAVLYFVNERTDVISESSDKVVETKVKTKSDSAKKDNQKNQEKTPKTEGSADSESSDQTDSMIKYIKIRMDNYDIILEGSSAEDAKEYLATIKSDIDSLPDSKEKSELLSQYDKVSKEKPKKTKTSDSKS